LETGLQARAAKDILNVRLARKTDKFFVDFSAEWGIV
jgi:hypothetical protein